MDTALKSTGRITIGDLQVRVAAHDPAVIPASSRDALDLIIARRIAPRFAAQTYEHRVTTFSRATLGSPSPVIRVKMVAPEPDVKNVISAGMDSSGLGIATLLGVPVVSLLARELTARGVTKIAYYRSPNRAREDGDQDTALGQLTNSGITVQKTKRIADLPTGIPVWLHAEHAELSSWKDNPAIQRAVTASLFWPLNNGGRKNFLNGVNFTTPLTSHRSWESMVLEYKQGFVVKPLVGRNGNRTIICEPEPPRRRNEAWRTTCEKVELLRSSEAAGGYVVQPLLPQHRVRIDGKMRNEVFYLFFIYTGGAYRLSGGFGMSSVDTKVVLKSTTILRPVLC